MKRLFSSLLAAVLLILLSACGTTVPDAGSGFLSSSTTNGSAVFKIQEDSNVPSTSDFNFETKTVMLNSGYEMPVYGIGTYSLLDDVCVESVSEALRQGVRLVDTAYIYHNEESVGKAVRESGIPRDDIFVITKLYPSQFADPEAAIFGMVKLPGLSARF